jgi:hypothetical protein
MIDRSRRPALKAISDSRSRNCLSITSFSELLNATGGIAPTTQPVNSSASDAWAKLPFRPATVLATAFISTRRSPGSTARTYRSRPSTGIAHTIALAPWPMVVPRTPATKSDRPSGVCSITRNRAFSFVNKKTRRSNTLIIQVHPRGRLQQTTRRRAPFRSAGSRSGAHRWLSPQVFTLSVQNVDPETPCMTPNQTVVSMGLCSLWLKPARPSMRD